MTYDSNGSTAVYTYSATGKKLGVRHATANSNVYEAYCDNFIYRAGSLKRVLVDGGYITLSGGTKYHYYLKDHLGNNRMVVNASKMVEEVNHYYPYGGLFGENAGSSVQPYKYNFSIERGKRKLACSSEREKNRPKVNGKELDRMNGLDLYDYGARYMDGALGRFTTIDPMCEKYYGISPYAYCHDNPVNRIDPDGKDDYYSFTGKYLASDNKMTDHIMIVPFLYIPEKDYPKYSIPIEDYNGSAKFYSSVFTDILRRNDFDTSRLKNGEISIYVLFPSTDNMPYNSHSDKYNTNNKLHIILGEKAPIGKTSTDNNHIIVSAIIHPLKSEERAYFSTVSNIVSVLGVHEFTAHGLMKIPDKDHWRILKLQQSHPSWKTIIPELKQLYQNHVKNKKEYQEPK